MVSEKRVTRATLLLVDRAAARLGARVALADEFRICGESDDVEEAIRLAKALQPDVCLIGRDVAGHDLASVREICLAAPACAVVVLSEVRDVEDMLAAVRAGAVGYVPGALEGDRLRRIVAAARQRRGDRPADDGARAAARAARGRCRCRRADRTGVSGAWHAAAGTEHRRDRRATPDHAGHACAGTYRSWFGSWASRTGRSWSTSRREDTGALARTSAPRSPASVPPVPERRPALGSPLTPAPFGLRINFRENQRHTTWQQQ